MVFVPAARGSSIESRRRGGVWRPARLAVALIAAASLLSACSSPDSAAQPPTLHDLLLPAAPASFVGNLDTPLTLDQASSVLSTDPAATKSQLSALGYGDGAEKVWVRGTEYVVDLVFEFDSAVGPGSLVGFERSQLASRPSVTLFSDGDVPGALGIDISAVTRAGARQVFCQGAMFPLDRYLFEVEDCAAGPRYSADPLTLTRTQYTHAAGLLGLPVASPSLPVSAHPT